MTISREVTVPGRRVVEARLPRMHHHRQPRAGGRAAVVEVGVPPRPAAGRASRGTPASLRVAGVAVHLEGRAGVDRRLGDARRLDVARRLRRPRRRLPERRPREVRVLRDRGVEHDVRHAAVGPLGAEERTELLLGLRLVVPRPAERHERRVPAPLVRVEGPGRQRRRADPVRVEHLRGAVFEAGQDVARRWPSRCALRQRRLRPARLATPAGVGGARVRGVVFGESCRSRSPRREAEEHDRPPRSGPRRCPPGRPTGRRRGRPRLGAGGDRCGVLRVLGRDRFRARERQLELRLDAGGDLGAVADRPRSRWRPRPRVAGCQQRAEDRLHRARRRGRAGGRRCPTPCRPAAPGPSPVSECEAGVPANPTPMPTNA